MLQDLRSDIRFGLRQLIRTPGFTSLAVATLAIGIGLNTALFGLIHSIVARPMPGVHTDARLVWIASRSTNGGFAMPLSFPDFVDYRDSSGVFSEGAAFGNADFSLASGGDPIRVRGEIVSGNYFSLLGVTPALGRGFAADEDRIGNPMAVAVIGFRLWRERFDGDVRIIGRVVMLDGVPFTIVGVAPERFNGLTHGPRRDVWVPMAAQPRVQPQFPRTLSERGSTWLSAVGRLASNVSIEQANARLDVLARRLAAGDTLRRRDFTAGVISMRGGMSPHEMNDVMPVAVLASAATLLIFLIACANVSNMLLARGVGRRREVGVRLSLGATRGRVLRQLLTESAMLAVAASAIGSVLALWATDILASIIPASLDVSPDFIILLFSVVAALITGLTFGTLPALHSARTNPVDSLKESTIGFDRRRSRLQRSFVVAQVSLSLVLLIAAGAFLGQLVRASRTDIGFDASSRVLAASFDLGLQGYTPEQSTSFVSTLEQRVAGLPGVTSISVTNSVPMGERTFSADIVLDPAQSTSGARFGEDAEFEVYDDIVRPNFFRTVGLPLIRGRDFSANDVVGNPYVAVVSEDFARRAWPGEDAIGKRFSATGKSGPFLTVIGVVRESALFGVGDRKRAIVFRPHLQVPRARDLVLLVRSSTDAATLGPAIRSQLRALDSSLPLHALQTLAQYRRDRLAEPALGSSLLAIVGAMALVLASVGVYAIVAFSVGQRAREIGVRVALGAAHRQVIRLFVQEGMRLTGVGVGVGLLLSAAAAKVLSSMFLGISPLDFVIFAGIALLLAAVAGLAAWIPARRAARVDPMVALRSE
jgi:predicted permease